LEFGNKVLYFLNYRVGLIIVILVL